MARRAPQAAATARLDFTLGILVSVGAASFVITVICELYGLPALPWALITGALAIVIWLMYRARRRLTERLTQRE